MKQIFSLCLIFFAFLVLSFSTSSARLLAENQDYYKGVKANNIPHEASFPKLQQDDLINLMGLEECHENDEYCLNKSRMAAEAHLDYIYTQHHKLKASLP